MEITTTTTAAAVDKGAELVLLTARVVVDAMALTRAQDYTCSCKKNTCIVQVVVMRQIIIGG